LPKAALSPYLSLAGPQGRHPQDRASVRSRSSLEWVLPGIEE